MGACASKPLTFVRVFAAPVSVQPSAAENLTYMINNWLAGNHTIRILKCTPMGTDAIIIEYAA